MGTQEVSGDLRGVSGVLSEFQIQPWNSLDASETPLIPFETLLERFHSLLNKTQNDPEAP